MLLNKKEKSSKSVTLISPESWFKHFTELFKRKTSEHQVFIPDSHIYPYTYLLKHSNLYNVHGLINITRITLGLKLIKPVTIAYRVPEIYSNRH